MKSADVNAENILDVEFGTIPAMVRFQAQLDADRCALMHREQTRTYGQLNRNVDLVASTLQKKGLVPGDVIAICAATSIEYVEVFLGALRAGVTVAPLTASARTESLDAMLVDASPKMVFLDSSTSDALVSICASHRASVVQLDKQSSWLINDNAVPAPVDVQPDSAFNIIYSSGTTGIPKGIVQPALLRWLNVHRAYRNGYGHDSVVLLSTPLYSNTTLATLFGAIALGSAIILMDKFVTSEYLRLAQAHRVTHTVLVPIQYQRILADPTFAEYDLSSFVMKFSTGAPFSADVKSKVIHNWPGGLIEIYGMTEGGGACMLEAHKHPNKLDTVGIPMPGNDIRLIDDLGREVAAGEVGEIVGHSRSMMLGYLNQPGKTLEVEWYDHEGQRFLRSGDIGRFDEDGYLIVLDRKKDVIISGGFNIYCSDLEAVLHQHPRVREVAVIGVPSPRWGETPVAFVVLTDGAPIPAIQLTEWANERLGKMQRLSSANIVDTLPRNPAGKVLKLELREMHAQLSVAPETIQARTEVKKS
jgi:long-chain acyl-CoA synthetase